MNIQLNTGYRRRVKLKETKEMSERIYIKTNRIGFIPPLGVQGPIVNPYPTTRAAAKECLVAGIKVFEVLPDKSVKELTLKNVFGDKPEVKKEEPKPTAGITSEPTSASFKGVEKKEAAPAPKTEESEPEKETNEVTEPEKGDTSEKEEPKAKEQNNSNKNNNGKKNKK